MRNGIFCSGIWVVDFIKFIDEYPAIEKLTSIHQVDQNGGGASFNVLLNLRALDPNIPLFASGLIGNDDPGKYLTQKLTEKNIACSELITREGLATSYTDVMVEKTTGRRTFFHFKGANSKLDVDDILSVATGAKIFHLGYPLLLDELDKPDPAYGTKTARLLAKMQEKGYKTSLDLISEESDRYKNVVVPALRYVDYLIINEYEAEKTAEIPTRDAQGKIDLNAFKQSAKQLMKHGVNELVVFHCPEGGYLYNSKDEDCFVPSDFMNAAEIISNLGAGDAFCAGMLYAIHERFSPEESLKIANTNARFSLLQQGGTGGEHTLKDIQCYLAGAAEKF